MNIRFVNYFTKLSISQRLVISQMMILILAFILFFFLVFLVADLSVKSSVGQNISKTKEYIILNQEKWRQWKELGLEEPLKNSLNIAKKQLNLESIDIFKYELIQSLKLDDRTVTEPNFTDTTLTGVPYVVVAKISKISYFRKYLTKWTFLTLALIFIFFFSLTLYSGFYIKRVIGEPIKQLNFEFAKVADGGTLNVNKIKSVGEMKTFIDGINKMYLSVKESEKQIVIAKVAAQVSHDIRSPLSALNMIIGSLKNIPEDQRIIMRSASGRINDIANELLHNTQSKHKIENNTIRKDFKNKEDNSLTMELLPALIDVLVSEKRIQFREKSNIIIETELDDSYGAFVKINSVEFKRVISNLINNSVEALKREDGRIVVAIRRYSSKTILSIRDNGNGIPPHILEKLGQKGVTHGKEGTDSGSGLGVYHAKKTIKSFGAEFEINSQEGLGTEIKMEFQKSETPNWFTPGLKLVPNQIIVALDDDQSVLGIWRQRLKELNNSEIKLVALTSENDFFEWVENNKLFVSSTLFLMDYELLNQKHTGLDLIEKLQLVNAILVTSRFDEPEIRNRCEKLNVRQIPKGMAPLVPIEIISTY